MKHSISAVPIDEYASWLAIMSLLILLINHQSLIHPAVQFRRDTFAT